jgi:hypothetical protein
MALFAKPTQVSTTFQFPNLKNKANEGGGGGYSPFKNHGKDRNETHNSVAHDNMTSRLSTNQPNL